MNSNGDVMVGIDVGKDRRPVRKINFLNFKIDAHLSNYAATDRPITNGIRCCRN
jgi:hypothetical protein